MATDDKSPAVDAYGGGGVVELPAPDGWKKKFTPKKSSRRHDILFVSPTGDEIRSKSQLDKYLKSHPGGPSASEFDWSTGETPRRSGRISDKVKATEALDFEPPSKRSSAKEGSRARKEDMDIENTDHRDDEDAVVEKENDKSEGVEKTDCRVATENIAQEAVVEEPMQPLTEETIADDSKKEQADDHVDTPVEEKTDSGAQNRLVEPEVTPENEEGGEVNAGLDVNKDDGCVKVETHPAESPQAEIEVPDNTQSESNSEVPAEVADNTLAESNSEVPANDTIPGVF